MRCMVRLTKRFDYFEKRLYDIVSIHSIRHMMYILTDNTHTPLLGQKYKCSKRTLRHNDK